MRDRSIEQLRNELGRLQKQIADTAFNEQASVEKAITSASQASDAQVCFFCVFLLLFLPFSPSFAVPIKTKQTNLTFQSMAACFSLTVFLSLTGSAFILAFVFSTTRAPRSYHILLIDAFLFFFALFSLVCPSSSFWPHTTQTHHNTSQTQNPQNQQQKQQTEAATAQDGTGNNREPTAGAETEIGLVHPPAEDVRRDCAEVEAKTTGE